MSLPARMIACRTARQAQRAIQAAYAFCANVDETSQELAATFLPTSDVRGDPPVRSGSG